VLYVNVWQGVEVVRDMGTRKDFQRVLCSFQWHFKSADAPHILLAVFKRITSLLEFTPYLCAENVAKSQESHRYTKYAVR
jgi:hypothetical protein